MNVNGSGKYTSSEFSGVYQIYEIKSSFVGGQFLQNLAGFRVKVQPDEDGVVTRGGQAAPEPVASAEADPYGLGFGGEFADTAPINKVENKGESPAKVMTSSDDYDDDQAAPDDATNELDVDDIYDDDPYFGDDELDDAFDNDELDPDFDGPGTPDEFDRQFNNEGATQQDALDRALDDDGPDQDFEDQADSFDDDFNNDDDTALEIREQDDAVTQSTNVTRQQRVNTTTTTTGGGSTTRLADGTVIRNEPDGSTTTVAPDGSVSTQPPSRPSGNQLADLANKPIPAPPEAVRISGVDDSLIPESIPNDDLPPPGGAGATVRINGETVSGQERVAALQRLDAALQEAEGITPYDPNTPIAISGSTQSRDF
jgi:hypothetical protein